MPGIYCMGKNTKGTPWISVQQRFYTFKFKKRFKRLKILLNYCPIYVKIYKDLVKF